MRGNTLAIHAQHSSASSRFAGCCAPSVNETTKYVPSRDRNSLAPHPRLPLLPPSLPSPSPSVTRPRPATTLAEVNSARMGAAVASPERAHVTDKVWKSSWRVSLAVRKFFSSAPLNSPPRLLSNSCSPTQGLEGGKRWGAGAADEPNKIFLKALGRKWTRGLCLLLLLLSLIIRRRAVARRRMAATPNNTSPPPPLLLR
mmetsp:Transcript_11386/g.22645  ORF Transcript_11386/g.22645 Transcript_11386/m.22645 type:complete len:200 (+) Transcript_11386:265-864(+)